MNPKQNQGDDAAKHRSTLRTEASSGSTRDSESTASSPAPLHIPSVKRSSCCKGNAGTSAQENKKTTAAASRESRRMAIWMFWLALPLLVTWLATPVIGQVEGITEYPPLPGAQGNDIRPLDPLEPLTTGIEGNELSDFISSGPDEWTSPRGLVSTIKVMVLLTVLSLAPAILMMTTSFVRIVVVMGLLRQALGTQQLPPSQVITSLSLFMTLFVMAPTFTQIKDDAILPYISSDGQMSWEDAWEKGSRPLRTFMSHQIEAANNSEDVWLFFRYLPQEEQTVVPETYEQVPIKVLLPAFLISELKVAFLIGFQIYLPFLVIDIVVSSVSIAMGMMMLPPSMISLPFKLILFVLVDGWHLVVGMLLDSFYIGTS